MKKILFTIMILLAALCLASCGTKDEEDNGDEQPKELIATWCYDVSVGSETITVTLIIKNDKASLLIGEADLRSDYTNWYVKDNLFYLKGKTTVSLGTYEFVNNTVLFSDGLWVLVTEDYKIRIKNFTKQGFSSTGG